MTAKSIDSALLDAELEQAVAHRVAPGIIACVASPTEMRYLAAHGMAQAANGTAMSTETVIRIASMTKLVTTVAVMMLADDALVDLDTPFARYVPGYRQPEVVVEFDVETSGYTTRPAASEITVRQLLTHTSGYGYWFLDPRLRQLSGDAPDLMNPPFLTSEPGERFSYGTSTDVLGQIIEPVTGLAVEEFFADRICGPLGMTDTSFRLPADGARLASVFERSDTGFAELENERAGPQPRGGGGLYSTARDYVALLQMFLNEGEHAGQRLLSREAVAEITRNQIGELFAERQTTAFAERSNDFIFMDGTQKFGLGVTIETRDQPAGRPAGTYGWGGIFNTYFWVDPHARIAVTLMMQMRPFADPECVDFCRRFEGLVYSTLT